MADPQLGKLKKATLVRLAAAALAALPQARRARILAEYVPERTAGARGSQPALDGQQFLRQVSTFVTDSLAEKYYDARPRKDARGWPEDPPLTGVWCQRAQELCEAGMALAAAGQHDTAAQGLEQLLVLLHHAQEGEQAIVYADEFGLHWYVLVDFPKLLQAFFTALARSTAPEEFARRGLAIASLWTWQEDDALRLLQRSARGPYRTALQRAQAGMRDLGKG